VISIKGYFLDNGAGLEIKDRIEKSEGHGNADDH
jgi:hypothetical protein